MPKPAKKSSKKLDPSQVFVVQSMTRSDIADTINGVVENEGWDVPEFTADDPRLTDAVCQSIADGTNEAYCDADDIVDAEYRYHRESVRVDFTDIPDEE